MKEKPRKQTKRAASLRINLINHPVPATKEALLTIRNLNCQLHKIMIVLTKIVKASKVGEVLAKIIKAN